MKAIQNSHKSKTNIIYNLEHYILYIVHFIPKFFSNLFLLLRRFVTKFNDLVVRLSNKVLGLYSFKTLWRRSRTFNGYLNTVSVTSLVLFVLLSAAVIVPIYNKANKVEAATSERTTPTLTLNITNATANLDLVVSDDDGTFAKSNSDATFTVTTNNFTGYTLSIKSSSSSTDLSGSSGSFTSISSSMDSIAFDSSTHNGKWGYLPSKYNSSANTTTYYPSPNATGSTIDSTSSANSTANSYTIAIGARADYSKPVGTYSNTYMLTTVINSFSYSISYNKGNTTDTVTNLPTAQTASSISATSVALSSTEPTRDGYSFSSWCSVMPTTNDGADSCSSDTYSPSDTFYFDKAEDNTGIILYAMWEKDSGIMQNYECSRLGVGEKTALRDARDGKKYTVSRLADGNCWMTQNLTLGSTEKEIVVSAELSDLDTDVTLPKVLVGSGTTGTSSAGGWVDTYTMNQVYSLDDNPSFSGKNYGYMYNYHAAVGYADGVTVNANITPTTSICPKGWKLPTPAQYSALYHDAYNSDGASFYGDFNNGLDILTGYIYSGGVNAQGKYSDIWSVGTYTQVSNNRAYMFRLYPTAAYTPNYEEKFAGDTIRCVAAPKNYMQGQTISSLAELMPNVNSTTTLYDKRDGVAYTIRKLSDGGYWMAQNLRWTGATDANDEPVMSGSVVTDNNSVIPGVAINFVENGSTSNSANAAEARYDGSKTHGAYYSWPAATAVCPSSWSLPTGGSSSEYTTIISNYGGYSGIAPGTMPNFELSGYHEGNYWMKPGEQGRYWSATAQDENYAYFLYMGIGNGSNSFAMSSISEHRYSLLTVRCVMKPTYMQDVTTAQLAALMPDEGDSATLYDKRDGANYSVAKIGGHYWMTQNLRFTGTSISPADTNINTAKTISYSQLSTGSSESGACYGRYNGSYTGGGWNTPCIASSTDTQYGAWYNYCAATAGTICTKGANGTEAAYDLCPSGWHMPKGDPKTSGTEWNKIYATSQANTFKPVTGGAYNNTSSATDNISSGIWWSATALGEYARYRLTYNNNGFGGSNYYRYSGYHLRCVRTP